MLLPDRLRAARELRGLGQRELARRCRVSSNQMNRYENGLSDPSTTVLRTIARELDVSTDYLLGLSENPGGYKGDDLLPDERELLEAYSVGDGSVMLMLMYERLKELGKSPHREET